MKRESKGQRVKTFKAYIPNSDLTKTETQVVVYFQAANGLFTIYDGAHMFDAARERVHKTKADERELRIHATFITANTLNAVVEGFNYICHAYEAEMKEASKKKVIRFTFKRNVKGTVDHLPVDDISFCGTPAIHITYEVLYQVGEQLYYKSSEDAGASLQYRGKANEARGRNGDAITVDWTPEREAFFANMQAALETLIHRVDDFQKNLLDNVDNAIAASAPLLLEKPR